MSGEVLPRGVYISNVHPGRSLALSLALCSTLLLTGLGRTAQTQSLPPLRPEDAARWETLVPAPPHLGLSPDGSALAYRIDRSNWDDELRVTRVADKRTLIVPFGREPEYSADGQWLMFVVGRSRDEEAQMKRDRIPIHDGLGLLQLSTFTDTRFTDVENAELSADGAFIAMERYPARATTGRGAGGRRSDSETPRVFVRGLTPSGLGAETAFDNVQEFAWQPAHGHRLAMHMGGDNQGGSRMQIFDPSAPAASGTVVIDDTAASFSRLSWRPDGSDLAYLRGHASSSDRGRGFDVVVQRGAGAGAPTISVYDAANDAGFPANTRIVEFRALTWSDDGRVIFAGIADAAPAVAPGRRVANGADVRIWHWTDVEVIPRQVEDIDKSLRRSRLAAVNIEDKRLVPLALSLNARATPIAGTSLAWVADWTAYAMDRTLGRPAADLSLVDTRTGERFQFAQGVDETDVHLRPGGGALVFLRNDHLWALNTATHAMTDLSAASGAAFIDLASDDTAPHKPLFGIGGWAADGAVLAYDRDDVWRIGVDGSAARKLTDGAATQTRYRLVHFGDADAAIDLTRPVYFELFGERTKQSGYARLEPGRAIERLIYQDRHIDSLTTSADGKVYAYIAMNFDASPNIFLAGASLNDARAVTATNPQQAKFAWGHSVVIDYTTSRGDKLQAALYYPAGYVEGRRYPTIVKLYERLSDEVHEYVAPTEMDEANIAIFTGLGYAVIAPDIRYRPRDPGVSTVDCVTPAVARAVAMGVTDSAHVGVIGHSWGAYGSAFLATHTNGLFAAAVAGAAITDLISQYGNHHWSTGTAETDHIETGQQRMQVPFYDDPEAYVRNSPIFGVPKMTTPLLLEAGDEDGEVYWHQSVELYNAARRAKKPVVLLQYPGEDHALDRFENRRDYQQRILAWFGHFLKNETAPPWITTGTPIVKR